MYEGAHTPISRDCPADGAPFFPCVPFPALPTPSGRPLRPARGRPRPRLDPEALQHDAVHPRVPARGCRQGVGGSHRASLTSRGPIGSWWGCGGAGKDRERRQKQKHFAMVKETEKRRGGRPTPCCEIFVEKNDKGPQKTLCVEKRNFLKNTICARVSDCSCFQNALSTRPLPSAGWGDVDVETTRLFPGPGPVPRRRRGGGSARPTSQERATWSKCAARPRVWTTTAYGPKALGPRGRSSRSGGSRKGPPQHTTRER